MKKEDFHILLDMDGVLSNFMGGVEELFDVDLSNLRTWNVVEEVNKQKEVNITTQEFWNGIQRDQRFWATLKPYPWSRDLVNLCLEKTQGNVTIVTSPDMAIATYSQKAYWVANKFPTLMRKLFIGPEKHLMAKPNHILIDDSDNNIEKFQEHGGKTITFPQKWNKQASSPHDIDVLGKVDFWIDRHMEPSNN